MIYYLFIYILSIFSLAFSNDSDISEREMHDIAKVLSGFIPASPRKDILNWRYKGMTFNVYYLSSDLINNCNHYSLVYIDKKNSLKYKLNFAYDMQTYGIIESSYYINTIDEDNWCRIL